MPCDGRSGKAARDALVHAVHAWSVPPRPAAVEILPVEDVPAPALLALAESAGLLVVGTRGRDGLGAMLLGSVSQQCLHHAHCAVIVVPNADITSDAGTIRTGTEAQCRSAKVP